MFVVVFAWLVENKGIRFLWVFLPGLRNAKFFVFKKKNCLFLHG